MVQLIRPFLNQYANKLLLNFVKKLELSVFAECKCAKENIIHASMKKYWCDNWPCHSFCEVEN